MVAITQEDLPYIVLTEDPALQAYRNDRLEEIEPICPAETGDLICDQVSYERRAGDAAGRGRFERRHRRPGSPGPPPWSGS